MGERNRAVPNRSHKASFPRNDTRRRHNQTKWWRIAARRYHLRRLTVPGLSVAGMRAGLAGSRSSLFMEQIRIVKEMRNADKQRGRAAQFVRPRFLCWENVPGAYSSSEGKDFLQVLQSIIEIEEPHLHVVEPPTGRWEYTGAVLGVRSSLAWATWDAQYLGVPQRRRRIFLVADFAGFSPMASGAVLAKDIFWC